MQTKTNTNGSAPPATAVTFTEAPASLNLKFDYAGFTGVMLTLRANSGLEVLNKLDGALAKLDKMGATPTGQRANTNGNGASVAPAGTPICPTHGSPMKDSKHGGGFYCPRKVADTGGGADGSKPIYCKATAK